MRDVERIEPAADEVRIRVRAFGINRAETYLRSGRMGRVEGPRVPGIEAVGEIADDPTGYYAVGTRVATAMGGMCKAEAISQRCHHKFRLCRHDRERRVKSLGRSSRSLDAH